MAGIVPDKYHLKSIHEEISLFDRKLAHLTNFEKFDSDEARDLATQKMTAKRETLVKTARRLAAEGVEFKPSELPRSLRPKDENGAEIVPAVETPAVVEVPEALAPQRSGAQQSHSPYTGTSLDWQASVRQYMQKKGKA